GCMLGASCKHVKSKITNVVQVLEYSLQLPSYRPVWGQECRQSVRPLQRYLHKSWPMSPGLGMSCFQSALLVFSKVAALRQARAVGKSRSMDSLSSLSKFSVLP